MFNLLLIVLSLILANELEEPEAEPQIGPEIIHGG